jgi:hypothetical protein
MLMHGPGSSPEKLTRAGTWLGRTAVVGLGVAVVTALAASPGAAATQTNGVAADAVVGKASANALNLTAGTQIANSGAFVAVNDGALETVKGIQAPKIPLVSDQKIVSVGALGQDAAATTDGLAAACAGVVGGDGALKLGADNSCLVTGDGAVEVSLGTLDQLGLTALLGGQLPGLPAVPELPVVGGGGLPALGELPLLGSGEVPAVGDIVGSGLPAVGELPLVGGELPTADLPLPALPNTTDLVPGVAGLSVPTLPAVPSLPQLQLPDLNVAELPALALPVGGLPDVKLSLVGKSITTECLATPTETFGKASPVDLQVVADVAGTQIPLADVPSDGLSLSLTDVLAKVEGALPAQATGLVDQLLAALPANALDAVQLAKISVGEKVGKLGEVTVTGLGVETAYPGLLNLALGRVTCGSALVEEPAAEAPEADAESGASVKAETPTQPSVKADAGVKASKEGAGAGVVATEVNPAANNTPLAPFGWGAVIAIMLAGVGLAAFKLRRLIRH